MKLKNKTARERKTWEYTALELAYKIANCRSEDPYKQVGACAIHKKGFRVELGYNGAPSGIEIDWSNRDERRKRVLHSEANVLNYVLPDEIEFIAVTHLPCPECIKLIANKRIKKVIFSEYLANYDTDLTFKLAKEFRITLKQLKLNQTP